MICFFPMFDGHHCQPCENARAEGQTDFNGANTGAALFSGEWSGQGLEVGKDALRQISQGWMAVVLPFFIGREAGRQTLRRKTKS
jgi:hypothetical protein